MITIYTLIEQKKGSLPTVDAFRDLEDAKKALLRRQEELSTDYRRSEPVENPTLFSNYILENVNGSGEEILLRLSQTEVKSSPRSRRLEIPLGDSFAPVWTLQEALENELDRIQATILRNERTVRYNNDPNGDERDKAQKTVEAYEALERLYKNKLEELKEIEERFHDKDFQ